MIERRADTERSTSWFESDMVMVEGCDDIGAPTHCVDFCVAILILRVFCAGEFLWGLFYRNPTQVWLTSNSMCPESLAPVGLGFGSDHRIPRCEVGRWADVRL